MPDDIFCFGYDRDGTFCFDYDRNGSGAWRRRETVLLIRIMTKMVLVDRGGGASGNNASTLQKSGLVECKSADVRNTGRDKIKPWQKSTNKTTELSLNSFTMYPARLHMDP
ncbi:hypothetical protein D5086_018529 [Populus alba]|uniref:Uncharacterized protein n=1 Tax=Populus alba TaxID=43335 RepID=A0ACC4BQ13_POPAL